LTIMDFTGQIAVVTGASSGIGKAIALELAGHGATLCLVGRNIESLGEVAEATRTSTNHAHCYHVDLVVDEDIAEFAKNLTNEHGRVDLLIHSAGAITL
jgi:NADP-dependent 3-hydroxy acid dehydrogenase YdfG